MSEAPICCVVDQDCEAAANFGCRPQRICTCFRCGLPVCKFCSSIRTVEAYDSEYRRVERLRRRVCNNCQEDMDGNDKKILLRLKRRHGVT